MRPNNSLIIPSQVANLSINSTPVWADCIVRASVQAVVTGTVNGAIQLQVSNEQAFGAPANQFVPTNWSDLGSSIPLTSAGSYSIPLFESSYEYLRVVYADASSGSATGTVAVRIKSMGL